MKFAKILILALSSLVFGDYLQKGTQPDCSYVVVTEDGWRMHKNIEGKVLSMKGPGTHNDKIGKYSLDEYGNLIEFSECISEEEIINKIDRDVASNTDIIIGFQFDSEKALESFAKTFSNPSFSINGGLTKTIALTDLYPLGFHYGLNITFNDKLTVSLLGFNISNAGGEDYEYYSNLDNIEPNLTGNGLLVGYNLNWKNFYLSPGIGMMMTSGENTNGNSVEGNDTVLKTDIGCYFGKSKKISIYGTGMLSLTEMGQESKAAYLNFGIRYNF